MASQQSGPPPLSPTSNTGVRRHHTISASSRRASNRPAISEEVRDQETWNDDEVVDQDWVGGVGVVGEKSSLHRQSSLPTRHHRAYQGQPSRQPGNLTPRTINSLSAIAGHEGDEEDWEREMRGLQNEEEAIASELAQHQQIIEGHSQSNNPSPLSPHFGPTHVPSPPPAGSGVRRHQSLTHGPAGGARQMVSLKRSGTLQASMRHTLAEGHHSPSPPAADEEYTDENQVRSYKDESYYARSPPPQQQQYQATSPIDRQSPWNTPGNEWRTPGSNSSSNGTIDDVQRALSALEIASNANQMYQSNNNVDNFQAGQSAHPPRFNPSHPPPAQAPGMRNHNGNNNGGQSGRNLQPLVTDFDGRKTPLSQSGHGPSSAAAFVPPIGHQQQPQPPQRVITGLGNNSDRALTVTGTTTWDQKERLLGGRASNPNLQYIYDQQGRPDPSIPNVPPIPAQYLPQSGGQGPRLGVTPQFGQGQPAQGQTGNGGQSLQGFVNSPIDVPSLIASKGYNPANFDIRPAFARFFVIKSYTEDDVHKSLKYEIWSSTDPGNKRLDKAFKECAGRGPIYLFFSVNASGHFCGMAEMLTPVDYTRSSTVWASDKWKGVFKVRWIFVRDIPNANLRHIRLNNTQERKPVTNSRDTQELLPDAGQEMLRIFSSHPARTSLLQDFAFYELQAMQKIQVQPGVASPPEGQASQPQQQQQRTSPIPTQQNPFAMTNQNSPYGQGQLAQMTPMMQMQMQMGMSMNPQYAPHPQTQAMHQSVMRHPSPAPGPSSSGSGQQSFMGTSGF